jgi:hypothetical protein
MTSWAQALTIHLIRIQPNESIIYRMTSRRDSSKFDSRKAKIARYIPVPYKMNAANPINDRIKNTQKIREAMTP